MRASEAGFESWSGPQGFRAEVHELDARVGGILRYDMIAAMPATRSARALRQDSASAPEVPCREPR